MKSRTVVPIVLFSALATLGGCRGELAGDRLDPSSAHTLIGQVLLPDGAGRRGVELHVTTTASSGEARDEWVLFDEQGRFSHTFRGRVSNLSVKTGIGAEVYQSDHGDLPAVDLAGRIDIGVIDLRQRLTRHRLLLRTADGSPRGDVRVAMWPDPPPVGPSGERVELGSRQFPPVALGSEMEWLLPLAAPSIYFLVERPLGASDGSGWRSGKQQLFGPFTMSNLPTELVIDG